VPVGRVGEDAIAKKTMRTVFLAKAREAKGEVHMRKTAVRAILALTVVGVMVFAASAATVSAQESRSIQGELIQVDTDAQTLVVRGEDGMPMQFQYTDETEVSGAQDSIAGLASEQNARVTVHFTEEDGARKATRIEVQPAQ
jgi:hypothetical protein